MLSKYLNQYEKNPKSRVFAPLAESYRKAGMLNDAIQVLKEGLKYNRDYLLGHVVLAHCYLDQEEFSKSYNVLRPYVQSSPDNIKLQKIYADSCYNLKKHEEALKSYKYILFMSPQDEEVEEKVIELESNLYAREKYLIDGKENKESNIEDWKESEIDSSINLKSDEFDSWNMKKISSQEKEEVIEEDIIETVNSFKQEKAVEIKDDLSLESPIMTHTMVDIYMSQKHFDKALDLIDKILETTPDDHKSLEKKKKIHRILYGTVIDEKNLEKKFLAFHEAIKNRAAIIRAKFSLT